MVLVEVFTFNKKEVDCLELSNEYTLNMVVFGRAARTAEGVMDFLTEWATAMAPRSYKLTEEPWIWWRDIIFFFKELGRRKIPVKTIPDDTYMYDGRDDWVRRKELEHAQPIYVFVDEGSPFHAFYLVSTKTYNDSGRDRLEWRVETLPVNTSFKLYAWLEFREAEEAEEIDEKYLPRSHRQFIPLPELHTTAAVQADEETRNWIEDYMQVLRRDAPRG